jgi:hypothetical protein
MLVLLIEGIYYVLVEMSSCMIFLPTFMKIGAGVQTILRFCPRNLRGSNAGVTDGKELWSAPLRLVA